MDGTEPSRSSFVYSGPFTPGKSAEIKAIAVQSERPSVLPPVNELFLNSSVSSLIVKVHEWKKSIKVSKPKQGIAFRYFEPTAKIDMTFPNSDPVSLGIANVFSVENKKRTDKFAFEFSGYLKTAKDGMYTFFTESDDGSKLFIDDEEVVNNDGNHGAQEKSGKAALRKGFHKIKVLYFDNGGGNSLKVSVQTDGENKKEIQASLLFH
jgi:hypothetical protein